MSSVDMCIYPCQKHTLTLMPSKLRQALGPYTTTAFVYAHIFCMHVAQGFATHTVYQKLYCLKLLANKYDTMVMTKQSNDARLEQILSQFCNGHCNGKGSVLYALFDRA